MRNWAARRFVQLATLTAATLLLGTAQADSLYEELNAAERESVMLELLSFGFRIDPEPEGKFFGETHIANQEIFRPGSVLDWLNVVHTTTQPRIVRDEVLWEESALFDEETVRETVRNLRGRSTLSVVAAVPIHTDDPSVVDMLIVTRDTWSLRLNTDFSATNAQLNRLLIGLTETNLVGLHKTIGVTTLYEPDTFKIGPTFIDPRIGQTRLSMVEQFLFTMNHDTWELEGQTHFFEFGLPLYRLDSTWGFRLAESHNLGVDRLFVDSDLRTYDDPETDEVEDIPYEVEQTEIAAELVALLRVGDYFKHDFSFGYGLTSHTSDIHHEVGSADARAAFERDLLQRDELASFLKARWFFFEPDYRTFHNFNSFAFAEDFRVGPELSADIDLGPEFLGSDNGFVRGSVLAGYWWEIEGALLGVRGETGGRLELESGDTIDRFVGGTFRASSPQLGPIRIHARTRAMLLFDRVGSSLFTLGGDTGLRGYPAGSFLGESVVLGHIELRTKSIELLTQYFGLVLFFDGGTIYDEGEDPEFLSSLGIGLRWVAPQAQSFAFRFDWGFPLTGPSSFFPGSLSSGTRQAF